MKKNLEDDSIDYNATSSYAELQALEAQAARRKSAIALARQVSSPTLALSLTLASTRTRTRTRTLAVKAKS